MTPEEIAKIILGGLVTLILVIAAIHAWNIDNTGLTILLLAGIVIFNYLLGALDTYETRKEKREEENENGQNKTTSNEHTTRTPANKK